MQQVAAFCEKRHAIHSAGDGIHDDDGDDDANLMPAASAGQQMQQQRRWWKWKWQRLQQQPLHRMTCRSGFAEH
jgi:hypothetical protein